MTRGRLRLDRCVAFVDLAGFTALTQAHGDDYAADVHDAFVRALGRACEQAAGVVCVKHLGDGALLTAGDVPSMLSALLAGVRQQGDDEVCLRVRAGVHTGPVLQVPSAHGPDVLGHTVNVAARLCGIAAQRVAPVGLDLRDARQEPSTGRTNPVRLTR